MRCEGITLPGGLGRAVICGRGAPGCWRCRRPSEYRCDFPVGRYKSGKKKGQPRGCDRHLCPEHAKHGETPGVDFCEEHYPVALAAHERRRARARLLEKEP